MKEIANATIMVGIPCSGKSTYIKKMIIDNPALVVLSIDNCVHFLAGQLGKTYDEAFMQVIGPAERMMWSICDLAIERNLDVVFDQTNLTKKARWKKMGRLPKNYKVDCVYFNTPLEVANARMNNPDRDKTIPDNVMLNMARSLQVPTEDEGFENVITINVT